MIKQCRSRCLHQIIHMHTITLRQQQQHHLSLFVQKEEEEVEIPCRILRINVRMGPLDGACVV